MKAFLGGTFDPVHYGHLNLAAEVYESYQPDELYFCPANVSPFKSASTATSAEHRLKMVKLAIEGTPFKILDIECKRPGPSYAIDTLKELQKMFPGERFTWILGDDVAATFSQWKEADRLREEVDIVIGSRVTVPTSSTEVRERIANNLVCNHLVPEKVLDYIQKNELY